MKHSIKILEDELTRLHNQLRHNQYWRSFYLSNNKEYTPKDPDEDIQLQIDEIKTAIKTLQNDV